MLKSHIIAYVILMWSIYSSNMISSTKLNITTDDDDDDDIESIDNEADEDAEDKSRSVRISSSMNEKSLSNSLLRSRGCPTLEIFVWMDKSSTMSSRQKRCSKANVPKNVIFIPRSCKSSKTFRCKVGCKTPLFIPNANKTKHVAVFLRVAKCTPKGVWKHLPNCKGAKEKYWYERMNKSMCAEPVASENLIIQENCSKADGSECTVSCKEGYILVGSNVIKCSNRKWPLLPVCQQVSSMSTRQQKCSEAIIPRNIVFLPETCKSSKKFKCKVGCKTPFFIPGAKRTKHIAAFLHIAKCTANGVWKHLPFCSIAKEKYWYQRIRKSKCPEPIAPEHLVIQDNCSRIGGSLCTVSCKKGFVLVGDNILKCSKNKWSPFPTCKSTSLMSKHQKKCSKAVVPKNIIFLPPTCKSSEQFECKVGCKTPLFIPGAKKVKHIGAFLRTVKCNTDGEWQNLPNCTAVKEKYWYRRIRNSKCPELNITDENLMVQDRCPRVGGSVCTVSCKKDSILMGPNIIECSKRKWSIIPKCEPTSKMKTHQERCSNAIVPKNIIFIPSECKTSTKFECEVGCRTSVFIPSDKKVRQQEALLRIAKCTSKGIWKNLPDCATAKDELLIPFQHISLDRRKKMDDGDDYDF